MTFDEVLAHVLELLERQGRVSYGALKRRFELNDEYLEDLRAEIIDAKRLAVDENGRVLVWTGKGRSRKAGTPTSARSPQPHNASHSEGERRQLTVMFCDLVGSTVLSEQLDPEELREVIRAYQEACASVIRSFEGYIAQYLGDGLLVYFGYPVAHEEDAARAVRAGLGILKTLHELNLRLAYPVHVRIGIHTGQVVIGETGGGEHPERLAHGSTPNIAARVQGKANPDTVYITAATYRLIAGLFECEDRGSQELKGISTPLKLYRIIGESTAQSRFDVAVRIGLTPLVGRDQELGLLQTRWGQAKAGHGQVVLLSGEAGIGKSRLVQELRGRLVQDGASPIVFRCSPYHQNTALYPITEHLQRVFGMKRTDMLEMKLEKLEHTLAPYRFPQAETGPLFAALLSLPHPDRAVLQSLSPQLQKQKTQEAFIAWLLEVAAQQPISCIWEDVHWADPSTLELLTLCLDYIPTVRMFAVYVFRPEFIPPWEMRSWMSRLTLSRLEHRQIESMIERLTGGRRLPGAVVQQIVAKTDGVPLFVEELTKMVLESESVQAVNGHYELTAPLETLAIPSTLQDSLRARLDRLGTAKEVAQLGATIGRRFSYALLRAVTQADEETLQHGLRQLVDAELVYQSGQPPHAEYLFKHALIQDTAYQSLLKSVRQKYHQHIAQVLAERFPDIAETHPELLAHHCTEAGLSAQAVPYWRRAGRKAIERAANAEAVNHLTRGLGVLSRLPDNRERAQQELVLQTTLGPVLMTVKGQAAPEVEQVYARARALCSQVGETPRLLQVLLGLESFYFVRAELPTAREIGEQCLTLAEHSHDPTRLQHARLALGSTLFFMGELVTGREHLSQAIALYTRQPGHARVVQDPGVASLSYMAWTLWFLGYPDQALVHSQQALALAQDLEQPYNQASVLNWAAMLHQFRQEWDLAQERAEAAIALSTEEGFPVWLAMGTILRGWALAEQGQSEEGFQQLQQGIAAWRATGAEISRSHLLAILAAASGYRGQIEAGLGLLAEALAQAQKAAEHYYDAEIYRWKGELLLSLTADRQTEAEACFRQALDLARRQQAKSLELRAALSMSRLWQRQAKRQDAARLLAEVYGWFTEGFDTADLQAARTLLRALTGSPSV